MPEPSGGAPEAVAVAFVSSHAALGGSERMLEVLLEALGPAWVDRLILLEDGPAAERLERAAGVRATIVPAGRRAGLLTGAWRLRRALAGAPPAVVHASGVKAALVSGLALTGSGVPVIWVKHDFSWDGPLAALVASRCAEVVGVSAAVLATFGERRRGLRRPPLHVVHNAVPLPAVDRGGARAAVRDELSAPGDGAVVVLVGRLHPAKGQIELVEAAPAVLERHPGARLLLVGGADPSAPAYAAHVRERIRALGLDEAVVLLGHREDVPTLTAAADVAVVAGVPDERGMGREGFGLAAIEALAVGTPVVGYADGALPEVLGDAAVLVAPGDRAALGREVAGLLDDRAARERLGAAGRRRFETHFEVGRMAEAMAHRYVTVARRGG